MALYQRVVNFTLALRNPIRVIRYDMQLGVHSETGKYEILEINGFCIDLAKLHLWPQEMQAIKEQLISLGYEM